MIPFPAKKYQVIYTDPPWQYDNKKIGGTWTTGAEQNYDTMSTQDICNLPIKDITEKNCALFLWATVPFLHDAFHVMDAWGFEYKTMITWRKIFCLGMGYWFRGQTEHLLLGIKGNVKAFHSQKPNFVQTPVLHLKHSEKPAKFRGIVAEVTRGLNPKIELFAREQIEGWDSWGNDLPSTKQVLLNLPLEVYS